MLPRKEPFNRVAMYVSYDIYTLILHMMMDKTHYEI